MAKVWVNLKNNVLTPVSAIAHLIYPCEPMSLSPIVDQRYRLAPTDVGNGRRVTICNVSLQGVEASRPVLHLAEFPTKRLVLERTHCQALTRLVGSALFTDWVGYQIDLHVTMDEPCPLIVIGSSPPQRHRRAGRKLGNVRGRGLSIVLIVIVILAFVAVYLLENSDTLWRLLQNFARPLGF